MGLWRFNYKVWYLVWILLFESYCCDAHKK